MKYYYDILGVNPSSSSDEIRQAYLLKVRVLHPDRFDRSRQPEEYEQANKMMTELNAAYEVLKDPEKRRRYDATLQPDGGPKPKEKPSEEELFWRRYYKLPTILRQENSKHGRFLFEDSPQWLKDAVLKWNSFNGRGKLTLETVGGCIAKTVFGAVGTGVFAVNVYPYAFDGNAQWFYILISLSSAFLLALGVAGIVRWMKSPTKDFLFLLPVYLVRVHFGEILFWPIWTVDNVRFQISGRNNNICIIRFTSGGQQFKFTTKEITNSKFFYNDLSQNFSMASYAMQNNFWGYIEEHLLFKDISEYSSKRSKTQSRYKILIKLILFLSVISFTCAFIANTTLPKKMVSTVVGSPAKSNQQVPLQYRRLPNGLIYASKYFGQGSLTIKNGTNFDAAIKLINITTNKCVRYFFVMSNTSWTLGGIPDGSYKALVISGTDFDTISGVFTRDFSCSEFDKIINFATNKWYDNTYAHTETTIFEITLHPVVGGNLKKHNISINDFTRYINE